MKNNAKRNILRISGLTGLTGTGLLAINGVANAAQDVRVETIEIDFQENLKQPEPVKGGDAQATTMGVQNQFIFLFALTVLGVVGIVGIIGDFRRKH